MAVCWSFWSWLRFVEPFLALKMGKSRSRRKTDHDFVSIVAVG